MSANVPSASRKKASTLWKTSWALKTLYAPEHSQLVSYLNNAIKAEELFTRDKDYIIRGGEVLIVDEFTGRVLAGRRYNEGMHQAIEAKEGVEIKNENQTLATIHVAELLPPYTTRRYDQVPPRRSRRRCTKSTNSTW